MRIRYFIVFLLISKIFSLEDHRRCPEQQLVLLRNSPPSLDTFYTTLNSTFMIHYDTTGIEDNPDGLYDLSDNNNNNVPDYIESIGIAADSVIYILNTEKCYKALTIQ